MCSVDTGVEAHSRSDQSCCLLWSNQILPAKRPSGSQGIGVSVDALLCWLAQLCQVALRRVSRGSARTPVKEAYNCQAEQHSPMIRVMAIRLNSNASSADISFIPQPYIWNREKPELAALGG
jgi:hypothetical protein